eukprot:723065-Rhodomonas_salina.2
MTLEPGGSDAQKPALRTLDLVPGAPDGRRRFRRCKGRSPICVICSAEAVTCPGSRALKCVGSGSCTPGVRGAVLQPAGSAGGGGEQVRHELHHPFDPALAGQRLRRVLHALPLYQQQVRLPTHAADTCRVTLYVTPCF